MHFVSEDIESFCISHSSPLSSQLEEIERYTRKLPDSVMLTGPLEARFLQQIVRLTGAKRILELGCYTGYSALAMAEALPAGGELITLDVNPETARVAQGFWDRSAHGKKIRLIVGPAVETLSPLQGPFDIVFIDADKPSYIKYLELTLPLLAGNGVILVDNSLYSGQVLDKSSADPRGRAIREFDDYVSGRKDLDKTLIPLRDGLYFIQKARP